MTTPAEQPHTPAPPANTHRYPINSYDRSVRTLLTFGPLLMAVRFYATAAWGPAVGYAPFNGRPSFVIPYLVVGTACVAWAFLHYSPQIHAFVGASAALLSGYRAVSLLRLETEFDAIRRNGIAFWGTFAASCLLLAFLGVEYAMVNNRLRRRADA